MTHNLSSKSQKFHIDSFIFATSDWYDGESDNSQIMRHGYGKHISANQQCSYRIRIKCME
jgi:hypothetical protein